MLRVATPMASPKYPLEGAAQAREAKVEQAARDLAAAVRARRTADEARLGAERRRDRHESLTARVKSTELDALTRGELRVSDLRRVQEWASSTATEGLRLQREVEKACAEARRAAEAEDEARAHLAARKKEAEVIARNRALWQGTRRRVFEAREEEASLEAWRPKK